MTENEVTVTQADRSAASALARGLPYVNVFADAMDEGRRDDHELVQAFAQHRTRSVGEGEDAIDLPQVSTTPFCPDSPEEWMLEQAVFNVVNNTDAPKSAKDTLRRLWLEFVLREKWCSASPKTNDSVDAVREAYERGVRDSAAAAVDAADTEKFQLSYAARTSTIILALLSADAGGNNA